MSSRRDLVVTHGAWSSGWAWGPMRVLMDERAMTLWTPSYTGLGERSHLATKDIDVDTHVTDVVKVLEYEDLRDVVLVAHSYGGMVGTGVADRARERVAAIVYLDAFVPGNGDCLLDLLPAGAAQAMRDRVEAEGDGWLAPPNPLPDDTPDDAVAWITPRRGPQPFGTFTSPVRLSHDPAAIARSYIYCRRIGPGDTFGRFAVEAKNDPMWTYREIDASHSPHITAPVELADLLAELAR